MSMWCTRCEEDWVEKLLGEYSGTDILLFFRG